ncbi:unnamed protein product, partial [marine sediment metagenome]
ERILITFGATRTFVQLNTYNITPFFRVDAGAICALDFGNDGNDWFENGTVKILLPGIK